ncbi:MAG: zinc ribbon domain-containing protein [Acidobacteria bacterium]|nr:zinc ribbon domain-containing protein [Acidobacteriota bacterium]MCB9399367.1 zinc ribbon domain-containing protein [Acidobacteriota bacterium]
MLIAGFGFMLLMALWIAAPLWRSHSAHQSLDATAAAERVDFLMRSLANAQKAHNRKRIGEEDYHNIERRLVLQIAKIYHQGGDIDPETACPACFAATDPKGRYCGKCGESLPGQEASSCSNCGKTCEAHFKFCPHCGAANALIEADA